MTTSSTPAKPIPQPLVSFNYNYTVKSLFSEGWEKMKGFKGSFWAAFAIVLIITSIGYIIIKDLSTMIEGPVNSADHVFRIRPLGEALRLLLTIFVSMPLGAGLWMMAIRRSLNLPIQYQMVFQYFSYWKRLWIYPIIFAVINWIGIALGVFLPLITLITSLLSLYIAVTYFMFVPLVVEKNLDTWTALETSRKAVTPYWFKTLWVIFLFLLITLGSLATAGIAFIWTLPWIYCVMGVFYRNMFGVTTITEPSTQVQTTVK